MTSKPENRWLLPALAAMFVWGFWAFLPKIALGTLSPHSVIFYESLGNFLVAVPVLCFLKFRLEYEGKTVALVAVTSVLTVTAILCFLYAMQGGPVAVIVTMTAMYPFICLLLARIFLKERVNKVQLAAIVMALCAILLLALPG